MGNPNALDIEIHFSKGIGRERQDWKGSPRGWVPRAWPARGRLRRVDTREEAAGPSRPNPPVARAA